MQAYKNLIKKYDLDEYLNNFTKEKEKLFKNYKRIINDIGDTFKNVYVEFLLHNVRNPIRSLVTVRNTDKISGRRVNGPSTRFVHQFLTNQGEDLINSMEGGSHVAYKKQFDKGRWFKATTTPIYDEKYGLVAIICINIDKEIVLSLDAKGKESFFEEYCEDTGYTPIFEL